MLKTLTIKNYALISELEISFPKGFSVITGETGAGKSIIIGALSLILGQRADAKTIKKDENKCFIEGVFNISNYSLKSFFEERELDFDPENCILRREIMRSGKSRAFINDTPVGLNDLKELGSYLIDIHSQHQNLLLADGRFQLQVLDVLADNKKRKEEYQSSFRELLSLRNNLLALKEKAETKASEQDYLRFQSQQLEEANLQAGEQIELETESKTLSHLEEIKNGLFSIEQLLADDEHGCVISLKNAQNTVQSLTKIYKPSNEILERIQSAYLDLKDLATEIAGQQEDLELDPEHLQWVNDRLDLLYSLQQKHKVDSVEDLIALRKNLDAQLHEIENFQDEIQELEKSLAESLEKTLLLGKDLSEKRQQTAKIFEQELKKRVSSLGMPHLQFQCKITTSTQPDKNGLDEVSFLFSANKNGELKPISETASGGEISRLMLGIKALIAGASALPTIIFDEIDTGVSGEVADKMGDIMHQMGDVMQVIAITHLPQIAAKGESQFFVYKEEQADFTETNIRCLNQEERIQEIAQMLSGSKLTEAAIENAKSLLDMGVQN